MSTGAQAHGKWRCRPGKNWGRPRKKTTGEGQNMGASPRGGTPISARCRRQQFSGPQERIKRGALELTGGPHYGTTGGGKKNLQKASGGEKKSLCEEGDPCVFFATARRKQK